MPSSSRPITRRCSSWISSRDGRRWTARDPDHPGTRPLWHGQRYGRGLRMRRGHALSRRLPCWHGRRSRTRHLGSRAQGSWSGRQRGCSLRWLLLEGMTIGGVLVLSPHAFPLRQLSRLAAGRWTIFNLDQAFPAYPGIAIPSPTGRFTSRMPRIATATPAPASQHWLRFSGGPSGLRRPGCF